MSSSEKIIKLKQLSRKDRNNISYEKLVNLMENLSEKEIIEVSKIFG